MSEPVGWLRAVVVDAADPPRLSEVWQGVLGVGVVEAESDWIQLEPDRGGTLVEVIHARPGESHYRMADPGGNEFTVVLPLPPDVAREACGPKGTPG
jgi:hypothetical protein